MACVSKGRLTMDDLIPYEFTGLVWLQHAPPDSPGKKAGQATLFPAGPSQGFDCQVSYLVPHKTPSPFAGSKEFHRISVGVVILHRFL